jgi:hypothetical protein
MPVVHHNLHAADPVDLAATVISSQLFRRVYPEDELCFVKKTRRSGVQRTRKSENRYKAWLLFAALKVGNEFAVQAAGYGKLFLREVTLSSQSSDNNAKRLFNGQNSSLRIFGPTLYQNLFKITVDN